MTHDVYRRLQQHLDDLPGGFPPTEDGVELRILRRLFTPHEAELACHLTLIPETVQVIAYRAGEAVEAIEPRLTAMVEKGLIFGVYREDQPRRYQAAQFVVGIYEYQLNKMDEAFIHDVEAYWDTLFEPEVWKAAPQLRTIPVYESVTYVPEVMPYEQAETLIRDHDRIAVAPCVCRQEQEILGKGCDKPKETCLSFDGGADFYVRSGMGRYISLDEAMEIIALANEAGLVLQPSNSKKASFICACCGCCCGVLRNLKRYPEPATLVATAFQARLDVDTCVGCGVCVDRCQMDAVTVTDGKATLNLMRCIGCGLCVSTCPTGALTLARKPASEQPRVPPNIAMTMLRLARERGRLGVVDLAEMVIKSAADRLLSR